ncbi:MAG: histidine kinase [Bacteroidota bacterium]
MEAVTFRRYSRLAKAGGWSILLIIYFMDEYPYSNVFISFLSAFLDILILMAATYIHYFLLMPLFHKGQRAKYFLLTVSLIAAMSSLAYFIYYYFPYEYEFEPQFWEYFIYNVFLITIILATTSLFYFVEAWYKNLQTESQLRAEKLQSELNFLKSQINPHFLFNTLNNIYAYAQTGDSKTAPMLEHLSSILRFMVYDGSEEVVELFKEVRAVENLLEIHRMKNTEQRNIHLEVGGVKGFHLIAPLIIVNFVENACKHSDVVTNPNGFIHVRIEVDKEDHCLLEIANSSKKKTALPSKYQGLGLVNIRKRLDLQYGESYTLEESKTDDHYQVQLRIPIKRKQ